MAATKQIPVMKFFRHKYGDTLLMDVVTLDAIRSAPDFAPTLRQSFYGLMLTMGGEGQVEVDGTKIEVHRGVMACLRPGDVGSVVCDKGLQGLELIFERDFLLSFFANSHFIDSIPYLSATRSTPFLVLDEALYNRVVGLYDALLIELSNANGADHHLLRAMLYEVLTWLRRATPIETNTPRESDCVTYFRTLVDAHFLTQSTTSFYADKLCVTPGHLNRLVQQSLGQSAKQYIQHRRFEEAERLLRYTEAPVTEIDERLGFDSATYFVRAFSKHVGISPQVYRTREMR